MAERTESTRDAVWVGRKDTELRKALACVCWRVTEFGAGDKAGLQTLRRRRRILVGVVDLRHVGEGDLQRLETTMGDHGDMRWIALVSRQSLEQPGVAEFIRTVCQDFLTAPVEAERLRDALGHAWGMARLGRPEDDAPTLEGMIGVSPVMTELGACIHKFAPVDVPVLITGETGTGKEVAARALHARSTRSRRPFAAINCGALSPQLVQSELFGHERGAFTGAAARKVGRFEAADGGTVFLDEIGDLPLDAQTNLLRFLQEGSIERVGSCQSIRLDVRVMAATHVDLEQAVAQGRFREDLYYRLNVLRLQMPPLRERGQDIERLARHFLEDFRCEHGTRVRGFSTAALEVMHAFAWPGNVRELMNRVQRAAVVAEGTLITPADLELARVGGARTAAPGLDEVKASVERRAVVECLRQSRFNVSECARRLHVSRVTVYRLCKKYDVAIAPAR